MGLLARKPVFGVCDVQDAALPAQLQRLARIKRFYKQVWLSHFPVSDNKGADQSRGMYRLVCTFVVHTQLLGFLETRQAHALYLGNYQ